MRYTTGRTALLHVRKEVVVEALWVGQRAHLRHLLQLHPDWTLQQVADAVGCSTSMVSKWKRRFAQGSPEDVSKLFSRSRARLHPPARLDREVVNRVLEIRLFPPDHLRRTPGSCAIRYYLHRDPELLASGKRLPRSTRTIWRLLDEAYLIERELPRRHAPLPPCEPLEDVQMDFKDASVPADPQGKHPHVIEVLNFVDVGTSLLLSAQVPADFHAETALQAGVAFLRKSGLPSRLTFDRDVRWVGSPGQRNFPSALCQFLYGAGVQPNILPPQHPELNAFVERFHRSYNGECLLRERPGTLEEVRKVTEEYGWPYNQERPHQGRSCRNQPPQKAHPILPPRPALPEEVDPDRWVHVLDGRLYARQVKSDGRVLVDGTAYYVKKDLAGQRIVLRIKAATRVCEVLLGEQKIKELPIKGLVGEPMALDDYIELMSQRARSEERQRRLKRYQQRIQQASSLARWMRTGQPWSRVALV